VPRRPGRLVSAAGMGTQFRSRSTMIRPECTRSCSSSGRSM
jgi:hypothetical protein